MGVTERVRQAFLVAAVFCPAAAIADAVDFNRDIRPIFEARCHVCHNAETQQSEFRLDSREHALRGGGSGVPAIIPGDSVGSILYRYVAGLNEKVVMPPVEPRLTGEQVEQIRQWIDEGAPWPEDAEVDAADSEPSKFDQARDHWAFQPRAQPSPPVVTDGAVAKRVRNPIDAFVFGKLESGGRRPSRPARPHQLLRRVYLDLIGLPPNLDEQEAYLRDPTPESLDRVIGDLLERPTYGERWARHWLDLVRYADTNGYERDAIKPLVYRYRDYVIRSFNADKPFDRFAIEQLAGDELPGVSPETLIATGFHRLGPWDDEPADPLTDRYDQLDDMVRTTSEVFLGLTLGCARCHNHKFEPLTARDYYSMAAIFNPLTRPLKGRTELVRPIGTRSELDALEVRDEKIRALEEKIEAIREQVQTEFLSTGKSALPTRALRAYLTPEADRDAVELSLVREFREQLDAELEKAGPRSARSKVFDIEDRICELRDETPTRDSAYILHEPRGEPPASHLLIRGKASNPGPEVPPAVPAVLSEPAPRFPSWQRSNPTTLRRLSLARWIADPDNPLTARVVVNRVWQFHFGEGIVRTPSDFGLQGEPPTHPELLDWLANWFIEHGWSLKKLHRLIMASNTYRMSKEWDPASGAEDPDNLLFWRFPYRRLEVEAIRDSMLAVSGRLNPQMYGSPMYPYVPPAALEGSSDPHLIWRPFDEEDASRRTIYAFVKRSMIVPMLEVLDLCDTTKSAAKRINTAVATQALTLFNGEFVNRQARHLAERLVREAGPNPRDQIDRAYRLALARSPTEEEQRTLLSFLEDESTRPAGEAGAAVDPKRAREAASQEALVQMCRVIFNMNEFVYAD